MIFFYLSVSNIENNDENCHALLTFCKNLGYFYPLSCQPSLSLMPIKVICINPIALTGNFR